MDETREILDEMLNSARLGKEPSKDYFDRLNALTATIGQCIKVSRAYAHIRSPTSQHYYASILFTMLLTRATSLTILAPFSPFATKVIEHWDYASATGIVRTMLELRLTFYYLCVDSCDPDKWNCRWNIFNLHDCRARARLIEASSDDPKTLATLEAQTEELRGRLRSNPYFLSLPEKRQRLLLKGETAYMESLEDIGEKAGVDRQQFKHLYRLFSSHVHALPMSFYRVGDGVDGRGRGLPTPAEEGYTTLCLTFGLLLLVQVRDEFETLFDGIEPNQLQEPPVPNEPHEPQLNEEHFKIGETVLMETEGDVQIAVTRTALDSITMTYTYLPTGDVVLRRSETEGEVGGLEWFDPVFWTVVVNGAPTTERMAEKIEGDRMAFKIDHVAHTLSFKIE